jgi:hypothetical protein
MVDMLLLLKIGRGIRKFSFNLFYGFIQKKILGFLCYGIPMFLCCSYAWTLGVFCIFLWHHSLW